MGENQSITTFATSMKNYCRIKNIAGNNLFINISFTTFASINIKLL